MKPRHRQARGRQRSLSAALLGIGAATVLVTSGGCSGTSGIAGFDEPTRDDAGEASSAAHVVAPDASDSDVSRRVDAAVDAASAVDARVTSDMAVPRDGQLDERAAVVPVIDASVSNAPLSDARPIDASEQGDAPQLFSAFASDGSVREAEAARPDGAPAICGVPGNCIVSSALPTQTTERAGTTFTLCPNGVEIAAGSCIVEANLGDAEWSAVPDGDPGDLQGTVGVRARDVSLVASTVFGPATCHFSVGGAGFAPLPVRVRLGAAPRTEDRVGCSLLAVSEVVLLGAVPTTVSGPPLCSEVVLPQIRETMVGLIESGLQQAIERRVCLR